MNLFEVYEMLFESNVEREIGRSENTSSWVMQIGKLLAEHMIAIEKAANQLTKKVVI